VELECSEPGTDLKYWAYLPPENGSIPATGLPLLVYLHGFSHSGTDLKLLLSGGVPAEIEKGRQLPMAVISPQCSFEDNWQSEEMVERLSRFIEAVVDMYHIDPQRIYLTGFSMGGDGVWALGKAHPEQFAALAPVSSWYRTGPQELCGLAVMPIWVFQSQADEIVSPRYAQQNVAQVQGCGSSQIKLSLFPSGGHEATSRQVYALDEFYQWFLDQK
jgi:predicted peptidase